MFWDEFCQLTNNRLTRLQELSQDNSLSTGYVYGLLNLIDMAEKVNEKPENAIWHSYFAYRTVRMLERNKLLDKEQRKRRQAELAEEIAECRYYQTWWKLPGGVVLPSLPATLIKTIVKRH